MLLEKTGYSIHIHLNSQSLEVTFWQIALIENYVKEWCAGELMSQKKKKSLDLPISAV